MMTLQKIRRTHLRDVHYSEATPHWQNGSFDLKFVGMNKELIIHCDRIELKCIVEQLWKVIHSEQKEVDEMISSMSEGKE